MIGNPEGVALDTKGNLRDYSNLRLRRVGRACSPAPHLLL